MKSKLSKGCGLLAVVLVLSSAGPGDGVRAAPAQEMKPIDIELPQPMFVGTPQNFRVSRLEKPLGAPRPPFLAPAGTTNVALGKEVVSSDELPPIIGELAQITDGDKEAADGSYVELGPFEQHVTIDLEERHTIYAVLVWHYHLQARVYMDVVVQVADDPEFADATTIFNNDHDGSLGMGMGEDLNYVETSEGKLIDARGVEGRYVRLFSRGNTSNDLNHYVEVAVYGIPAS